MEKQQLLCNCVYLNTTNTLRYAEVGNARIYYSYETPIIIWFYGENKAYQLATRFSATTSKHTTFMKRNLNKPVEIVSCDVFNQKIKQVSC